MTNEEMLLRVMLGEMEIPETFQPQTNKQAYLAYGLGLLTDFEALPLPRTNEELLLYKLAEEGFGGGSEYAEFPEEFGNINTKLFVLDNGAALFSANNSSFGLYLFKNGEYEKIVETGAFYNFVETKKGVLVSSDNTGYPLVYVDKVTGDVITLSEDFARATIAVETSVGVFIGSTNPWEGVILLNEDTKEVKEVYSTEGSLYNFKTIVELDNGVLLGTSTNAAYNSGMLYYDIATGESYPIAAGEQSSYYSNIFKVDGGAVVPCGTGICFFEEATRTLTTINADFSNGTVYTFRTPHGLIITNNVSNNGIFYYDEPTRTASRVYEGDTANCSVFVETSKGLLISCSSYSIPGLWFFDYGTLTCTKFETTKYNFTLGVEWNDTIYVAGKNASGVSALDMDTMTLVSVNNTRTWTYIRAVKQGILAFYTGWPQLIDPVNKTMKQLSVSSGPYDVWIPVGGGKYVMACLNASCGIYIYDEETNVATKVYAEDEGGVGNVVVMDENTLIGVGNSAKATNCTSTYAFTVNDLTLRKISELNAPLDNAYHDGDLLVLTKNGYEYEVCINKKTLEVTERVKVNNTVVASGGVFYA